jgi:hypothetical protein
MLADQQSVGSDSFFSGERGGRYETASRVSRVGLCH